VTRKTVLSTTIPPDLVELFKNKAAAIKKCGVRGISPSSLAASFLASRARMIEDLDPETAAALLGGKPPDLGASLEHFSMGIDAEIVKLLSAKAEAMQKKGCDISLSSLAAAFLVDQTEEIEDIDPEQLAQDMEDDDGSGADEDSAGGDPPEGAEADGPPAEEGSPGEDQGDEEGAPEEEAPGGPTDKDGDEEVLERQGE